MSHDGVSAPVGFQWAPGMMGSTATEATSSSVWSLSCAARGEPAHDEIRVGVAREQRRLEEHEARRPDGGRAAEPWQDLLRDDRLHQEQQERADEDGGGVEEHWGGRRAMPRTNRAENGKRRILPEHHGQRPDGASAAPEARGGPSGRAQYVVLGRKYSTRSIECTWSSFTSTPCSTRSGMSVPAAPRPHTFR